MILSIWFGSLVLALYRWQWSSLQTGFGSKRTKMGWESLEGNEGFVEHEDEVGSIIKILFHIYIWEIRD